MLRGIVPVGVILISSFACAQAPAPPAQGTTPEVKWDDEAQAPPKQDEQFLRAEDGSFLAHDHVFKNGKAIWTVSSPKYVLAAAATEEDGYLCVDLAILNASQSEVTFDPEEVTAVDVLANRPLRQISGKQIRRHFKRRAMLAAFFAGMGGTKTSTTNVDGTYSGHDQDGNWTYGTYSGTATTTTDDPAAGRRAANEIYGAAEKRADRLTSKGVLKNTLFPNEQMVGSVYFQKPRKDNLKHINAVDEKSYLATVIVTVGAEKFSFFFPVEVTLKAVEAKGARR